MPRTAHTIDLAVGERDERPILRRRDGQRLDRRTAHRRVRSIGKRAGLGSVHLHMLRAAFIIEHCMVIDDIGEDPDRWLVIGPDQAGNLLEIIVLITAEGDELIIHAMRLRAIYRELLDP